jgi:hypothetical protein
MLRVWSGEGPPAGLDAPSGRPPSSSPSFPRVSAAFNPPISIFTRCPARSSRGLKAKVSVSALIAPPDSETSWAWSPPKSTASTVKLAGPRPWRSSSRTAALPRTSVRMNHRMTTPTASRTTSPSSPMPKPMSERRIKPPRNVVSSSPRWNPPAGDSRGNRSTDVERKSCAGIAWSRAPSAGGNLFTASQDSPPLSFRYCRSRASRLFC